MIEPWINGLSIGVFGILTGAVLAFNMIVNGARRAAPPPAGQRWNFTRIIERSREKAEAGSGAWKLMPRSGKLALLAFYGLVAAMIAIIKFSPLTMIWWAYLGALFAGYIITQRIYAAARAGKLGPAEHTPR